MMSKIFIDIETKDIFLKEKGLNFKREDIKILGLGILFDDVKKYYNFFVNGIKDEDFNYLQDLFDNNILIGHLIMYDILGLTTLGFNFEKSILLDTIFLQGLINENEPSYSLKNLARKYLKIDKTDYLLEKDAVNKFISKNKQKNYYKYLDELDQEVVAHYCLKDLELTEQLFNLQCEKLPAIKEFVDASF